MQIESSRAAPEIPDSRLYTLIDEPREYALYFLEGQRLIHDLALLHEISGPGFAYFRDVVLSVQPMIAFLKRGEQFGFYIDSESPYFRLKIETGHQGDTRSVLVPEAFSKFPEQLDGIARVRKLFPNNRPPYLSVLRIEGAPARTIVNRVLTVSFQVHSAVIVSQASDQSAMLHQLPPLPGDDEYDYSERALRHRRDGIEEALQEVLARALIDQDAVVEAFASIGFRTLAVRAVRLWCGCSRDRMMQNLHDLAPGETGRLFDPGQSTLDITCEYCKSVYHISRTDLEREGGRVH